MSRPHQSIPLNFTVLGEPASKANQRKIVRFGKRLAVIKSAKARNYVTTFQQQCPKLLSLIEDDVAVWIRIYYASRRPDLDDSVILDAMQGLVYVNDRVVKERHIYWSLDRENPRSEIWITEVGAQGPASVCQGREDRGHERVVRRGRRAVR